MWAPEYSFGFGPKKSLCLLFQSCDIRVEGKKRFLTLKHVQLDQAGEVSYQALNAVTSAMLTVKGTNLTHIHSVCSVFVCRPQETKEFQENTVRNVSVVALVNNCSIIPTGRDRDGLC